MQLLSKMAIYNTRKGFDQALSGWYNVLKSSFHLLKAPKLFNCG